MYNFKVKKLLTLNHCVDVKRYVTVINNSWDNYINKTRTKFSDWVGKKCRRHTRVTFPKWWKGKKKSWEIIPCRASFSMSNLIPLSQKQLFKNRKLPNLTPTSNRLIRDFTVFLKSILQSAHPKRKTCNPLFISQIHSPDPLFVMAVQSDHLLNR